MFQPLFDDGFMHSLIPNIAPQKASPGTFLMPVNA